jgi:predicted N-acyltransferase
VARGDVLQAACPLYLKAHSYGEYVFDWAWANAYEQHGLRYYPKA